MIVVHDYRCTACHFIFEEWLEKEDVAECPNCGSRKCEVVFVHPPRMQEKKQPYDYLHRRPPDDPVSVSVPKAIKKRKRGT